VHGASAGRCADDDLHGVAGPAADDPEHVQDRRRADADGLPRRARSLATHALSIFGDHSDVMACAPDRLRDAGSGSVQEAHDMALIAQAATLESRCRSCTSSTASAPRTRCNKIVAAPDDDIRAMIDDEAVARIAIAR
jgi:hypothetical protein